MRKWFLWFFASGLFFPLQSSDSLFCKAEVFLACYDDVVEDFDVEDLAAPDQVFCYVDVFISGAWCS